MENNYTYSSSHNDSGDSSPRSREIECETAVALAVAAWDEAPPQSSAAIAAVASARVKLMCSYGGRIMPRSHDNQLSYAGGDTKILAVDRSIRYPSILAKLTALSSSASSDDVILKYQLPGEDLDALISVTNDEDLEHLMMEYDRLHRTGSKPVPRLRLFLFSVMGKGSQDRASFADTPPPLAVTTPKEGLDYLFGLEAAATTTTNFLLPEAEMKDPVVEKAGIEVTPALLKSVEAEAVVPTPADLQMHVQELQRLQIAEKQQQQQRNGSDETLARAYPAEYYAPPPPVQDKAPPAPAMEPVTAPPPAYWQDPHRSVNPAPGPRFASFMGGDGNLYLIPTNPGVYPSSAAPGQTYYATVQRIVPTAAYDNSPAVYGAAPPQQAKGPAAAYDNGGVRAQQQQAVEVSAAGYGGVTPPAGAYDNGAGYAAYDNTGRPVYYAGPGATYQTVSNVAIAAESKVLKPSQVSS